MQLPSTFTSLLLAILPLTSLPPTSARSILRSAEIPGFNRLPSGSAKQNNLHLQQPDSHNHNPPQAPLPSRLSTVPFHDTDSANPAPPLPFRIPTRHESTVLARRLLALSSTAVLSTTFPSSLTNDTSYARTPSDVAGASIALPEYIATCQEATHPGDVTILALDVSTSSKNSRHGRNVSLSVSWWEEYRRISGGKQYWSRANLPRMALVGYMEEMTDAEEREDTVVQCFEKVHGDARWWRPGGNGPHTGRWERLRVEEVYWIGGFGDRAWIGWFDVADWRAVAEEEWRRARLPGEEGS